MTEKARQRPTVTRAFFDAKVAELEAEIGDEEHSREMHASLNRRAAEALGKPPFGEGSSWHDIPEQITALRAALSASEATIERLRKQNHEAAARFQRDYEAQIRELKLRLIPDECERQQRERVKAFLQEHPNERGKDERSKGLTGYSQNDGTAVFMAFQMYDEVVAQATTLREALESDAAGQSAAETLRAAADYLLQAGGGPLEYRLRLLAQNIESALEPLPEGASQEGEKK